MHFFQLNSSALFICDKNLTNLTDDLRLIISGLVGTIIAMSSIIENLLLFYVFSTSRKLRRQNYANPVLLALFDVIVTFCYLALNTVHVVAYHYRISGMVTMWIRYLRLIYCIEHIALTISNLLLVVASVERYLANFNVINSNRKSLLIFIVQHKISVILIIFLFSIIFKGSLWFETTIIEVPHCPLIYRRIPVIVSYGSVPDSIRFWTRKLFTVILPFFLLAYCNLFIVVELRKRHQISRKKPTRQSSIKRRYTEKNGVRVATRTLVMVVGCYILTNCLSTLISIGEFFYPSVVRHRYFYAYLVASDIADLLTILGCALRLPIYVINDKRIRKALVRALVRCRYRTWIHRSGLVNTTNLEKWSLVIVSNSLRSVITTQETHPRTENLNKLAVLLQNRRRLLLEVTNSMIRRPGEDSTGAETSCLTDIAEVEEEDVVSRRSYGTIRCNRPIDD